MPDSDGNGSQQSQPTTWVSIGKASKLLGVNESTLRQWADRATIRTFRTSGGHRRFAQEDLYLLTTQSGGKTNSKDLSDLKDIALTRIRRRLHRRHPLPERWLQQLPEEQKLRLRNLGRQMLVLVSDYLARRRRRSNVLNEARAIGEEYGIQAANFGMSLDDALEAFLFFRNSLDSISTDVTRGQDLKPEQALNIWKQLNNFMDQVLLATIRAYQSVATDKVVPSG